MINSIMEPASNWRSVTTSDTNLVAQIGGRYPRALYIGGAGDLVLQGWDGTDATFAGLPAGGILDVMPKLIKATGTTATNILALY